MAPHGMPPVRMVRALLMYRNGVPHWARFWSLIMFIVFYQFTGGVYVASISQIVGELAYINEDVTMASYCSLIGLTIIFPMLFRLKFYFYTRQMFFVSSIGCLMCAVLAYYVEAPWLFCLVCLLAGYFKMMGMFSCVSTVQLNWTPTRSFGVFLPIIYLFVCGCVQLSGIVTTWVAYFSNWKLMYCVIVVMMLCIDAIVYFFMKPDHRSVPFAPLKGLDWTGLVLWTSLCVAVTYIFNYGEHYDWWDSQEIWNATWIAIALGLATLLHTLHRPDSAYIVKGAFSYRITLFLSILLIGIGIMEATAHYLQPIYVNAVLGYDVINSSDLNLPELCGIVMGCILAFYAIIHLKWSLRQIFFCVFVLMSVYTLSMYFLVGPNLSKEMIYVPLFAFGVSEAMMETVATYALSQTVPWPHFFMNITIIGFARCGVGTSLSAAIVERWYALECASEPMMVAMRECYGWASWVGVAMLLAVLCSNYRATVVRLVPKLITVARGKVH